MKRKDQRVRTTDLLRVLAVKGALAEIPNSRVVEIVSRNPRITVHQFYEEALLGVRVMSYGGTMRAYYAVYGRLRWAKRKLGLIPNRADATSPVKNQRSD